MEVEFRRAKQEEAVRVAKEAEEAEVAAAKAVKDEEERQLSEQRAAEDAEADAKRAEDAAFMAKYNLPSADAQNSSSGGADEDEEDEEELEDSSLEQASMSVRCCVLATLFYIPAILIVSPEIRL